MIDALGFKPVALVEFNEAISRYECRETGLGARFEAEIKVVLARIKATPEHFPVIARNVRKARALTFPYSIYFTVGKERIMVISVYHGSRDPQELRRRIR